MAEIFQDFEKYDALGLADLVRRKEVKPIELVETVIERIERINPQLNCVVLKYYDLARDMAQEPLPDGQFTGVPFLLKDILLLWGGVKMTAACRYLKDFVAPDDSVVVQRIKQAGMILVGKTNTPEQGLNATTEPVLYGPTKNPWNLEHVAGGSSGGSGAAVAARILPLADANDGGGSIRIPASNNGVVGLKPCRGRVTLAPHYGDFWYGGAIGNCVSLTVRDTAAYLDVIAGPVPGDPYQPPKPERPFLEEVSIDPGKLKIGFTSKSPLGVPTDQACVSAVEKAAKLCSDLGHDVSDMEFTFDENVLLDVFIRTAAVLGVASLGFMEILVGRPPTEADFEKATWEVLEMGKPISGSQHATDVETLRQFSRQIAGECEPYDIVLTPTQPNPPVKLGTYNQNELSIDALMEVMAPAVSFTLPLNVSGQPAMSLPLHWTDDGLPVGVQLIGRCAEEATIFRLAGQLEKAQPWIDRKPPVCA